MIDSHAHLYTPELSDDLEDVMKRFRGAGGKYIVNCAADPSSCNDVISQSAEYEEILPTVGLHPELVIPGLEIYTAEIDEAWIDCQIDFVESLIRKHSDIIAVGECGLDYFWVKRERLSGKEKIFDLQKKMLAANVELALERDLPLVVHCRDEMDDKQCEAEILDQLVKVGGSRVHGVFHSYTGSLSYLEDILVCEPVFVGEVAEFVAKRKKVSVERLWEMVDGNFRRLFGV
jgi:TatD DNase family protein